MPPPCQIDAEQLDTVLPQNHDGAMKTVTYASARRRLAGLIESVKGAGKPVLITRRGEASVVLVDAAEFATMAETLHLLASMRNASRLRRGLADFKAGKFRTL
jgi:antitoxin YefM